MVREGRVFDSVNAKPVFGVGYTVVVLEPGAEVAEASSGTTITVHPGHGLATDDFVIADLDTTTYRRVLTVTSTTIEVAANLPVAAGQHLINLGADAGSTGPDFQGSGATIYTDSGYVNEALYSHVRAGSDGTYRYYHLGIARWELILGEIQEPLGLVIDTASGGDDDFLPLDLDGDGTDEIAPYAEPFAANRYLIYIRKDFDASLSTADIGRVQAGILQTLRWTGDSTAANRNASGIFAINQFGDPTLGTGGGNVSGPSIAIGGYSEHYGDGTWGSSNAAFLGGELAATIYGATAMGGAVFGCLGIAQINNGTLGGTAVLTSEFIGVRGLALAASGSSATIATAIGVDGVVTQNAAGTITNAYGMRSIFNSVLVGTITNAYGMRIEAVIAGTTSNYGLYIGGASGGATTNQALYVGSGATTFADTTAYFMAYTNNFYLNDGTDRDSTLWFNAATADGAITYKGGSATNVFEFNKPFRFSGAHTELLSVSQATEEMTLSTSGTTTDSSANLLPAGAMLLGVVARVTTTVATATDWKLGDASVAGRFLAAQSGAQLTAGATATGLVHLQADTTASGAGPGQAAAAKLRVTTTGTPSAGTIRVTVNYLSFGVPAS